MLPDFDDRIVFRDDCLFTGAAREEPQPPASQ